MTFGQLRTFLEVARGGSVRAAAAALVVSEPSVSAAVSSLQRELGVPLVEREGRGIRLTTAGQELARYAALLLGVLDQAHRAVRQAGGLPGHLRLAAVTTAGEYVLPPVLKLFREVHPTIELSLEVGNRTTVVARLLAHEVDLAIGGRPPWSAGVLGDRFLDNPLMVVGAAGHPLATRREVDPHLLSGETWLLREAGSGTRETTEEFLRSAGIEPRSVMTLGSNGAVKQAAAVGLGVTLISEHAVSAELAAAMLAPIPAKGTPVRRDWHALWTDTASLPPAAEAFFRFLRSPLLRRTLPWRWLGKSSGRSRPDPGVDPET